jgi:mono/diheme cytochrome c family protein
MHKRSLAAKVFSITLFAYVALAAFFSGYGPFAATSVEAQRSGSAIYAHNCVRCHGADGRAQTRKGRQVDAVDFTGDDWSPDTERDTRIVTNGKKSMPSFKRKLTPAQIGAVVQYIRRFKR